MVGVSVKSSSKLGWEYWVTCGILLQKMVSEEECKSEEATLRRHFECWAEVSGSERLLSAQDLRNWLRTYGNQFEITCFSDFVLRLLDRDSDGYLQMNEFILAILILILEPKTYVAGQKRRPTPALLRARRQLAFRFYDEDSDGYLSRREWDNVVRDDTASSGPGCVVKHVIADFSQNGGLVGCVNGVQQCLDARTSTSEFTVEHPSGSSRKLAETFWEERRNLITYDSYYDAIETGVLSEPVSCFQFGNLSTAVAAKVKSQRSFSIPHAELASIAVKILSNGMSWIEKARSAIPPLAETIYNNLKPSPNTTDIQEEPQTIQPTIPQKRDMEVAQRSPVRFISIMSEHLEVDSERWEPATDSSIRMNSELPIYESVSSEPPPALIQNKCTRVDIPSNITEVQTRDYRQISNPLISSLDSVSFANQRPIESARLRQEVHSKEKQQIPRSLLASLYKRCLDFILGNSLEEPRFLGPPRQAFENLEILSTTLGSLVGLNGLALLKIEPDKRFKTHFVGHLNGDLHRTRVLMREILLSCGISNTGGPEASRLDCKPIRIVITGNILARDERQKSLSASSTLDSLFLVWILKALFPRNIILLRGVNESGQNSQLKDDCTRFWGQACGLKAWNMILDAWELIPLACLFPTQGCVYGGRLSEEIAANFGCLEKLTKPIRLEKSEGFCSRAEEDEMIITSASFGEVRRAPNMKKFEQAVVESYDGCSSVSKSAISAAIKLRHLYSLQWVIEERGLVTIEGYQTKVDTMTLATLWWDEGWKLTTSDPLERQLDGDITALTTSAGDNENVESDTHEEDIAVFLSGQVFGTAR